MTFPSDEIRNLTGSLCEAVGAGDGRVWVCLASDDSPDPWIDGAAPVEEVAEIEAERDYMLAAFQKARWSHWGMELPVPPGPLTPEEVEDSIAGFPGGRVIRERLRTLLYALGAAEVVAFVGVEIEEGSYCVSIRLDESAFVKRTFLSHGARVN